jgi:lipid-binding SYLF domain-containing protein
MNETGMKHLANSKFTLGGDATVAAGPVGRAATAQTDASMHAEMLSYSRARGIFAGIVLDRATLRPDDSANRELYRQKLNNKAILTGDVKTPPEAPGLKQCSTATPCAKASNDSSAYAQQSTLRRCS